MEESEYIGMLESQIDLYNRYVLLCKREEDEKMASYYQGKVEAYKEALRLFSDTVSQ